MKSKTSFSPEYIERIRNDLLARNEAITMLRRRLEHEEDALRLVRGQTKRLRRALADMLEEFNGYWHEHDDQAPDYREPKVMQRARALLKEKAR